MTVQVLHVVHAFRAGGMENMVAQMAWCLQRRGFSVSVCALTIADDFKERLPLNTPVFELNKRSGFDFRCVISLRKLINHLKPDVVHCHNWNCLVYSFLALVGSSRILIHGEHAQLYEWELSSWRVMVRKALYTRCHLVHTVSKGQALELVRLGIVRRFEVEAVENGVDTEVFRPISKEECRLRLGIPKNGSCIGMVARCVPEKRHALLLDAFEMLGGIFPDLYLAFAGAGGNAEAEVRTHVEKHPFARRIVWLGHRDSMPDVYNSFDLMVLPSIAEGMSNVCLEAMSCGLPVLVNQSCGALELVENGRSGFVEKFDSAKVLARLIADLLSDPIQLLSVGRRARSIVIRDFTLGKTAQSYMSIYRRFVTGVHCEA
jgi:glycosyltransferase involved in cell wall biosynthesis